MVLTLVSIVVLSVSIIGLNILYQSNQTIEPDESDEPDEPDDPYLKGWDSYFNIRLYFLYDPFILNYTIPSGYRYRNIIIDVGVNGYPDVFAVPSDLFENFSLLLESEPYNYQDLIPERVYEFERYSPSNIYGDFYPPSLDTWFIFIVKNDVGTTTFTYADTILDH